MFHMGAVGFNMGGSELETLGGSCLRLGISDTHDDWTKEVDMLILERISRPQLHCLLSKPSHLNDENQIDILFVCTSDEYRLLKCQCS